MENLSQFQLISQKIYIQVSVSESQIKWVDKSSPISKNPNLVLCFVFSYKQCDSLHSLVFWCVQISDFPNWSFLRFLHILISKKVSDIFVFTSPSSWASRTFAREPSELTMLKVFKESTLFHMAATGRTA